MEPTETPTRGPPEAALEHRSSRTNVERTATTRRKLIAASIECLHRLGYASSSTSVIADAAKVSRGAMLHHFPTKVDLMLSVVDHAFEARVARYNDELLKRPRGQERWASLIDLQWAAWSQPAGIAVIEIMVAARSDKALAERLTPVLDAQETDQREKNWAIARSAGIADRATVEASVLLDRAAIRGLCIDLMQEPRRTDIRAALDLMKAYRRAAAHHLIEASAADQPAGLLPAKAGGDAYPDAGRLQSLQADNDGLKLLLADAMLENQRLREGL